MSIGRAVKALLGGFGAFLVLALLGELTLRVVARQVGAWNEAGLQLAGWRLLFTEVGLFFARYFIFMLPVLLFLCMAVAFVLARRASKHVAA